MNLVYIVMYHFDSAAEHCCIFLFIYSFFFCLSTYCTGPAYFPVFSNSFSLFLSFALHSSPVFPFLPIYLSLVGVVHWYAG